VEQRLLHRRVLKYLFAAKITALLASDDDDNIVSRERLTLPSIDLSVGWDVLRGNLQTLEYQPSNKRHTKYYPCRMGLYRHRRAVLLLDTRILP
jgi:hypothetical protein